jgi:uncharacterized protein YbbC (DUF1343 family)
MKHLLFFVFSTLFISCSSQPAVQEVAHESEIITGARQMSRYMPLLSGKRVGVVANQTSLIGHTHLVDTLLANKINVVAVFAPEHGFRGDAGAGEHVADGKDPKTGIPVLSLYGKTKKPTPTMLTGIDLLIFDIQDVGARFYTYISTLHYVLEAAAENNLQVLVLDRPNPNGFYIDGPVREEKYTSFVGMHPIPIVHGLTIGELTQMIVGEYWLTANPVVTIIPCLGYTHDMRYSLPVRPSPNLPNDLSIALYPSLCWFEGTEVSVGRGTSLPFQVMGFPGCKAGSYTFTPEDIPGVATNPPYEHELCSGLDLRETNAQQANQLELSWLLKMYDAYPDKQHFFSSNGFFDKLCGTAELREMVVQGKSAEEIRASWLPEIEHYKTIRRKYLLYPDFE